MLPAAVADSGDADQCRLLLVMEFGLMAIILSIVVIVDGRRSCIVNGKNENDRERATGLDYST